MKIKKLYLLIIKAFLGPFLLTFAISLFVLLMQFLWKYIDDLVGKGLEMSVIAELLFYASAQMVPLALPLAILISSIMTYGSLGEHYELVAAKASGISLMQMLRPLLIVALMISALAFYFSNYILPKANLQAGSLLYDVTHKKPAINIQDNVFYNGIDGYSIRVNKKDKDGVTLYGLTIYDHSANMGNIKVMIADSGKMLFTPDAKTMIVILHNGSSYEEMKSGERGSSTHPLLRTTFRYEELHFDLSSFSMKRTDKDLFKENKSMLNVSQLNKAIKTYELDINMRMKDYHKSAQLYFNRSKDSVSFNRIYDKVEAINPLDCVAVQNLEPVRANAINQATTMRDLFYNLGGEYHMKVENITRYKIEWHRKFTLSIACFVLFIIGAPLGAIIRKGGLGVPIIIAIIFFLLFHVTSITGEKMARELKLSAMQGMWLATFVLAPIGLFLIYKASKDSGIFDWDAYKIFFRRIVGINKSKAS